MNDLIVLVTLWDGPKHGYRLKKEAGQILGLIDLHNNLIYPLLRRFAAKRLVSKKTVPGKRGQTRQLYALTALGRRTVIRRLSEYNDRDARSPEGFLLRVGMFEAVEGATRERILDERKGILRERNESLSRIASELKIDAYGGEVIRYLFGRIRFELKWIERLRTISRRPA